MSENVIGLLVLLLIALGIAAVVYWVYRPMKRSCSLWIVPA
jgi:cbb3-type cytochrome oxidase subunit 3